MINAHKHHDVADVSNNALGMVSLSCDSCEVIWEIICCHLVEVFLGILNYVYLVACS